MATIGVFRGAGFSGNLERKATVLASTVGSKSPVPIYTDENDAKMKVSALCRRHGVPEGMNAVVTGYLTKWLLNGNWPR